MVVVVFREVLPVEVKTVEIERKIPIQNRPRPVKLNDIYFYVVNTENFDDLLKTGLKKKTEI